MTMEKGIVKKSILSLCTVLALFMTMPFSVFAESTEDGVNYTVHSSTVIDSYTAEIQNQQVSVDVSKQITLIASPPEQTDIGTLFKAAANGNQTINITDKNPSYNIATNTNILSEHVTNSTLRVGINYHNEYVISFDHYVVGSITYNNETIYFSGTEYRFSSNSHFLQSSQYNITGTFNLTIPNYNLSETITVNAIKSDPVDLQPIIDQLNSLNNRYNIPLSSFSAYDGWLNYGEILHPENFNSALSLMDYSYPALTNFNIDWSNKVFRCYNGHNVFAFYWPYQNIYNFDSNTFETLFNMTETAYAASTNRTFKYIPMGKGVIQIYEWDYSRNQASFSYSNGRLLNDPSTIIVPLFCGSDVTMNDELKNLLKIQTVSEIESSQKNEQLKTESQQMFDFEDQMGEQMNQSLSQIQLRDPATFGSSFAQTANWVRDQFNMLTLQSLTGDTNPIGTVIFFSLSLGLAMLIIGRGMFR